jgi:alpha-glucosidase (family GH31 glycosyl hydrolase)
MWHAWEMRVKCTRFWWESPKERDHSEDQGIDGIRKDLTERLAGAVWIGFDWLRIVTGGEVL